MYLEPYHEIQRPRQWWLWLILIGTTGMFFWGFYQQIVLGKPTGDNPPPDWLLILISILVLGILLLFATSRMKIIIDSEVIAY